jgi:ABC-type transport system substrate-binding protein
MNTKILLRTLFALLLLAATLVFAAPKPTKVNAPPDIPPFPGTLLNSRFVYVTSYDGDQFNPHLFPEDRNAIGTVQDAMQKWGKFTLVYEPHQADIILMVMSRPSEDVLAVYDAHSWPTNSTYLWRMMGRNGLQLGESPFVTDLELVFDQARASK